MFASLYLYDIGVVAEEGAAASPRSLVRNVGGSPSLADFFETQSDSPFLIQQRTCIRPRLPTRLRRFLHQRLVVHVPGLSQPAVVVCLHRADGSTCTPPFRPQILFLIVGLVTVLTGPLLYWRLDNSPAEARFLTEEERVWACERVRANQTGMAGNYKWDLSQMFEAFWSPVTWLYLAMAFAVNMGASGKYFSLSFSGEVLLTFRSAFHQSLSSWAH